MAIRARMRVRLQMDPERVFPDAEECFRSGARDVVRVFIKNEPHSRRKLVEGRFRLIMNSSLTDIMCDRIVMETLARAELNEWETIPSKPGMGLDDVSIRKLLKTVPKGIVSSDMKHYDWSVQDWLLLACSRAEGRQYRVSYDSDLARLLRVSALLTGRKVFVTSNGTMLAQVRAGIQESGSRGTAFRNSKMRVILAYLTGASWAMAMGDDAGELTTLTPARMVEAYARLGFEIELAVLPDDVEFEFCSTHFRRDGRAEPQNHGKTFYRLLGQQPDRFAWEQFKYELRGAPASLREYQQWLQSTEWGVVAK